MTTLKPSLWIVLLLVGSLCVACSASEPPLSNGQGGAAPSPGEDEGPDPDNVVNTTGTVVFKEMEGGFWGIIARDSTQYDPGDTLPDSLRTEGLEIRFEGEANPGAPSMRMWGTPIDIIEAMPLDHAE